MTISPTQSNALSALGQFLQDVLPSGWKVVTAQSNRVPEPTAPNFVVMSPLRIPRIATNLDSWADVQFAGSIAGTVMTVTSVAFGTVSAGATIFGTGVAADTTVSSQISGLPGGAGTYAVTPSQTVGAETMAAGAQTYEMDSEMVVQLDFHSADLTSSDAAATVATLARDEYAFDFFAALEPPLNSVYPLLADDPIQRPFISGESQYEWRWIVEFRLQINQVVSASAQYATSAKIDVISVEATYPS